MGINIEQKGRPFPPFAETINLVDQYPSPTQLRDTYINTTDSERIGIIRLWMTEGIPFAFKNHPILYEEVRGFIANGTNVNPKEVTLVGSGRTGYSLSKSEWGRPFNNGSDFDFVIISNEMYGTLVKEFQTWVKDFSSNKVLPQNPNEMRVWLENIKYLDKKIPSGFIQLKLLPYNNTYPLVKKCYDTLWILKRRLRYTKPIPSVADASIRVYSSWGACVRQLRINFNSALSLRY